VLVEFFDVHVHSDENSNINGHKMRMDTDKKSSIATSPQNLGRGMFQTRTMDLKNGKGNNKAIFQVQYSNDDGKQGAHIIARDIFPGKIHALSASHDGLHFAGSVTSLNPKSRIKVKESIRLWSQTGKLLHATVIHI